MRKILSAVLAIFFTFSMFCGVSAKDDDMSLIKARTEMPKGGFLAVAECDGTQSEIKSLPKRGVLKPIEEYLETQLLAHAKTIDLSGYNYFEGSDFSNIVFGVIMSNYEIMAYTHYQYSVNQSGIITSMTPHYMFKNSTEDADARNFIRQEIENEYLSAVADIPNDDVVGKMLVIHDLFCKNNVYAQEEAYEEQETRIPNYDMRTAYYLFSNNRAVCQGNSIALKAIYDALNEQLKIKTGVTEDIIKTSLCKSEDLTHMWNVVKVEGEWYYIDETWDDHEIFISEDEILTGCFHDYFMVPLYAMGVHLDSNVDEWTYYCSDEIVCDDDKYMSGYIFNGNSYTHFDVEVEVEKEVEGGTETETQLEEVAVDCGPYYGTVSYEGGRYKIEIIATRWYNNEDGNVYLHPEMWRNPSVEEPFWSETAESPGFIATDAYDAIYNDKACKLVYLFSNYIIGSGVRGYFAKYGANGLEYLSSNKLLDYAEPGVFWALVYRPEHVGGRVLIWSDGGIKPLCRTIDIN